MASHVHRTHRSGWVRAGLLGANDGVLSISGLLLGVAATHASPAALLVAGVAGLVAGALSMGSGEYVSVSSQADTERADLSIETQSLQHDFPAEQMELRDIYVRRGLDEALATEVARQLMAHDALGAHARDDIGITEALTARPLQAAATSAISFTTGGMIPLLAAALASRIPIPVISTASLSALVVIGALAAHAGGAPIMRGAVRVLAWGGLVMIVTSLVGLAL